MSKPTPHHPSKTRQLVVIANDFQVPFHDERALGLFKRFLKRDKPRWLVLNGDFQDFWEISSFDLVPRAGKAFLEEIAIGRRILRSFRQLLPKARITWLEGNHEFRLRKYLLANAPELQGLPGLTVPDLFRLKDLKIDYVPCHPGASKFTDNFIRVGNLYVGHWDRVARQGGYAAKGLVEDKGVSVLQGHTHRFGAHARTTVDGRVLLGIENFSMCRRNVGYVAQPNWQVGFSVVYLERGTGLFQWYPVAIGTRGFVWNGHDYAASKHRHTSRTQRKKAA
jgi:hypothetical protein